jgi:fluoride ion exporter CrcB/FEX
VTWTRHWLATTFSTFGFEVARLVEDGDYRRASGYAALSVVSSLLRTFAGFALARGLVAAPRGSS